MRVVASGKASTIAPNQMQRVQTIRREKANKEEVTNSTTGHISKFESYLGLEAK